MQKHTCTLILFVLVAFQITGQTIETNKFRTSIEYGYFGSNYSGNENGGDYLNTSFGYKINQNFWLNLDIIKITATGNPEFNSLIGDITTNFSNTMFIPNFSKDWIISSKVLFNTALGGALYFEKEFIPRIFGQNSELVFRYENANNNFDLGLFINLGFTYEIHKRLFVGLNIKSYVGLYLEPESFMIGPSIEFRL